MTGALLGTIVAFENPLLGQATELGALFMLLVAYSWATLLFVYLLQFFFTAPATGLVCLIFLNIAGGKAVSQPFEGWAIGFVATKKVMTSRTK